MKRVYLIVQKQFWNKGKKQIISDGNGKLLYVFVGDEGKRRAENTVKKLNKDLTKQTVYLIKGWIEFYEVNG